MSRRKSIEIALRLRVGAELVTELPALLLVTGLRLLLLSRYARSLGFMVYLLVSKTRTVADGQKLLARKRGKIFILALTFSCIYIKPRQE